jgi:hypothetical protein
MGSRCGLNWGAAAVAVFALVFGAVVPAAVEAADKNEALLTVRCQALSAISMGRAKADWLDIKVTRWSTDEERDALTRVLVEGGNKELSKALAEQEETGWVRFDPRAGGGPGRDPRKTKLYYAREIDWGDDTKEIILVTHRFIGYGSDPQAADGSKIFEYPISVVIMKFAKDDKGEWQGAGTMDVGSKIRYSEVKGRFIVDSFSPQPFLLKRATVK